ncbi:MAG TPA: hypothetical protein VEW69_09295, partial [Alphaproteobacteria bacterium]|nr:hypothetical protein [Alphaproteobacteria bacterium]
MIDTRNSRKQSGKASWSSRWLIVVMILVVAAPMWAVQSNAGGPNALEAFKSAPEQDDKLSKELDKYPGLLPELGRVMQRLQAEVQLPAARRQSRLLPMA